MVGERIVIGEDLGNTDMQSLLEYVPVRSGYAVVGYWGSL